MAQRQDGWWTRRLHLSSFEVDGWQVLDLDGECDGASLDQLRTALDEALAQDRTVLITLGRLTFCDVRSAALLLEAARTNRVVAVGPTGVPLRLLDLLDPAGEVPRYPTLADAIGVLSDTAPQVDGDNTADAGAP